MGLFDRTLGSLRAQKENVATLVVTPSGTAAFPNLQYDTYVREGYQKNELVYTCVEEWATDIAEAQIKAYTDGPDEPEEVKRHGAVALLNHPNPFLSGDDLLGGIEMYKRIAGNAYTLKVRSAGHKVVELWLLRPDRVRIVPDRQRHIHHYEYRIGAEKFDLPPEDVIHDRTRNPYDDLYGMPPLMAASGRTDIDNFMRDMVKGFLQNSGVPAGILQVAGKLTDQEKALVRARFRNEFGGGNAGNLMVSDGGTEAPHYTPMSMPLGTRGLIVPELDEMDEARICMVFRVPLSLVGARLAQIHSTLGQNGRIADQQFFSEKQLIPEWKSLASNWTRQLLPDFGGADRLEFDLNSVRSLTEDQNALHTRVRSNVSGLVQSIQESRAQLGLPRDPKPDDIFLVPMNVVPTTWADLIAPPEPVPVPLQLPPAVDANGQPIEKVDNLPSRTNGSKPKEGVLA